MVILFFNDSMDPHLPIPIGVSIGASRLLLQVQTGGVYHGARMLTSWFKIEDLWISNTGLDESGILAIAGIISNGGSLIDYADYDTYITHHWSPLKIFKPTRGVDFSRVEE